MRHSLPKNKKKYFAPKIIFLFIIVVLILLSFIKVYKVLTGSFWKGSERLSLIIRNSDDGGYLVVADPVSGFARIIVIPPNTQIEASRNLGSWKLSSLWKLGVDEGLGGALVAKSITKTFLLPTEAWSDVQGLGFVNGRISSLWQAIASNYDTNLTIKDRLRLAIFFVGLQPSKKVLMEASEVGLIKSSTLPDGEEGYVPRSSSKLQPFFTLNTFGTENTAVSINYFEDGKYIASQVGEIVEALGAKVYAINPLNDDDLGGGSDCQVSGNSVKKLIYLASLFGCEVDISAELKSIDIKLGENFLKRF